MELEAKILSYLDIQTLQNCTLVSKDLRETATMNSLWEKWYLEIVDRYHLPIKQEHYRYFVLNHYRQYIRQYFSVSQAMPISCQMNPYNQSDLTLVYSFLHNNIKTKISKKNMEILYRSAINNDANLISMECLISGVEPGELDYKLAIKDVYLFRMVLEKSSKNPRQNLRKITTLIAKSNLSHTSELLDSLIEYGLDLSLKFAIQQIHADNYHGVKYFLDKLRGKHLKILMKMIIDRKIYLVSTQMINFILDQGEIYSYDIPKIHHAIIRSTESCESLLEAFISRRIYFEENSLGYHLEFIKSYYHLKSTIATIKIDTILKYSILDSLSIIKANSLQLSKFLGCKLPVSIKESIIKNLLMYINQIELADVINCNIIYREFLSQSMKYICYGDTEILGELIFHPDLFKQVEFIKNLVLSLYGMIDIINVYTIQESLIQPKTTNNVKLIIREVGRMLCT